MWIVLTCETYNNLAFNINLANDLFWGDGLYKLEASDQIPIVHSVNVYVIVFRNKYCLNQNCKFATFKCLVIALPFLVLQNKIWPKYTL